jgi:hypothetical protein
MLVAMPYRDDLEALESRCKALEAEAAGLGDELIAARRLLAEAQAQRKLPVVDDLRDAAPCSVAWGSMSGDAQVRTCTSCAQKVYDVSSLSRDDARALLVDSEGRCAGYFRRADGTLMARDCAPGVARQERRRRRLVVVLGAAAVYGVITIAIYLHGQTARREAAERARAAIMEQVAAAQQHLQRDLARVPVTPPAPVEGPDFVQKGANRPPGSAGASAPLRHAEP